VTYATVIIVDNLITFTSLKAIGKILNG